jgi:hypothetical protein
MTEPGLFQKMRSRLRAFVFAPGNAPMVFLICFIALGITLTGLAAAWQEWQAHVKRVEEDKFFYDSCLIGRGSTVVCDAVMRMRERYRR